MVKFHADLENVIRFEHKLLGGSPRLIRGTVVAVVNVGAQSRSSVSWMPLEESQPAIASDR